MPLGEAKHQQDLLKDYLNHVGGGGGGAGFAGGQSLRRLRAGGGWLCRRTEFKKTEGRRLRGRTCCHISVLFRTTQIIQELLFSKMSPPKISFQEFNSNFISPKIFPITNTNLSNAQLKKVNYITYRFKPRSSLNKVDIPPQHYLTLFSEKK